MRDWNAWALYLNNPVLYRAHHKMERIMERNTMVKNVVTDRPNILRAEDMPVQGFPNLFEVLIETVDKLVGVRNQLRFMVLGEESGLAKESSANIKGPNQVMSEAQYVRALADEVNKLMAELDVRMGGILQ